jgi:hypothetical protein
MDFQEVPQQDGSIDVIAGGKQLVCVVCGGTHFHERNSLLNTRAATFFRFDWANKDQFHLRELRLYLLVHDVTWGDAMQCAHHFITVDITIQMMASFWRAYHSSCRR